MNLCCGHFNNNSKDRASCICGLVYLLNISVNSNAPPEHIIQYGLRNEDQYVQENVEITILN